MYSLLQGKNVHILRKQKENMKCIQGRPVKNQAHRVRVVAKPPLHKAELLMFIIPELSPQNSAEHRSIMEHSS